MARGPNVGETIQTPFGKVEVIGRPSGKVKFRDVSTGEVATYDMEFFREMI